MKRNVLIVEDDLAMRVFIRCSVLKSDLNVEKVYEAGNGKEGLKILKKIRIDLLLTDINMPIMDGMKMLYHIRRHPMLRKVPTTVITTIEDKKLVDTIDRWGLGYIHKPFTQQELEKQILKMDRKRYGYALYG